MVKHLSFIPNIGMKYCRNTEVFTIFKYLPILVSILLFYCQYFQCKNNISGIMAFHCKCFQCEANIYIIMAFDWKKFAV